MEEQGPPIEETAEWPNNNGRGPEFEIIARVLEAVAPDIDPYDDEQHLVERALRDKAFKDDLRRYVDSFLEPIRERAGNFVDAYTKAEHGVGGVTNKAAKEGFEFIFNKAQI